MCCHGNVSFLNKEITSQTLIESQSVDVVKILIEVHHMFITRSTRCRCCCNCCMASVMCQNWCNVFLTVIGFYLAKGYGGIVLRCLDGLFVHDPVVYRCVVGATLKCCFVGLLLF